MARTFRNKARVFDDESEIARAQARRGVSVSVSVTRPVEVARERVLGVVDHFNMDRGFGFIRVMNTEEMLFVHRRDCDIEWHEITGGLTVTCEIEPVQSVPGRRETRNEARNVRIADEQYSAWVEPATVTGVSYNENIPGLVHHGWISYGSKTIYFFGQRAPKDIKRGDRVKVLAYPTPQGLRAAEVVKIEAAAR